MRTNTTKAKLAAGQVVFGAIISRHAPDLVELFGAIGYDFVMIDCEHGPMSLDEVEHMVRAAEVFGITPITRIPNHEDSTILRFLDRGVQGIIVPHVNTREAAEAVAKAARYWPDGHRGMAAGGRAHDYGVGVSRDESTRWINARAPGDPHDRRDRGRGQPGRDPHRARDRRAARRVRRSRPEHGQPGRGGGSAGHAPGRSPDQGGGKLVGVGGNSPTDAAGIAEFIKLGANFVTISALGLLRLGADDFRRRVQAAL